MYEALTHKWQNEDMNICLCRTILKPNTFWLMHPVACTSIKNDTKWQILLHISTLQVLASRPSVPCISITCNHALLGKSHLAASPLLPVIGKGCCQVRLHPVMQALLGFIIYLIENHSTNNCGCNLPGKSHMAAFLYSTGSIHLICC